MAELIDYRLALILSNSRQLVGIAEDGDIQLPHVSIPMWQRPAEQLTRAIEERWHIKTLVLDILPTSSLSDPCAVIEVRSSSWDFASEGFRVVSPETLSTTSLSNDERHSVIATLSGCSSERFPFSALGWIEEAKQWISSTIDDRAVTFTDEMRQLNAGGAFCLLRLGTNEGPSYWLKAVGEPNIQEFGITTYLAEHAPNYLPHVVAARSDWNAWVMEDFGHSLDGSTSLMEFELAVRQLALLQKRLIGRSEALFTAGCGDHRIETLRRQIDPVIAYLDEAMQLQTSNKVPKLSSTRLREIGYLLHETCYALRDLGIPNSLMHNDISPGSILSNGQNCVFTDWCEAFVGNPFITLEQVCVHAANNTNEPERWSNALRSVYKSCWTDVLTEYQIDRALQLVPLISVLSYLAGRGKWLTSERRNEPSFLGYSRSLARHMDRISHSPGFVEGLCQCH